MTRAEVGRIGEMAAATYYREQGYEIFDANFRTRQGELDVVAGKDDLLVIIEVKTRTDTSFAAPAEAVTTQKQQRLILAAQAYIQQFSMQDMRVRFDVAEVILREPGKAEVHCIENAFSA